MTITPDTSLLGAVSDNDRRRWQLAAARALTHILKRAEKAKLKPIHWTLGGGLALVGNLSATDYGNIDRNVAEAFDRWAKLLCLKRDEPLTKSGGGLYLVGRHDNWRPRSDWTGARVSVIAQTFAL